MDECKPLPAGDGSQRAAGVRRGRHGTAVLVAPIKPKLKPPGYERLKLKYDIPLSSLAFDFNLRRYSMGRLRAHPFFQGVDWDALVAPGEASALLAGPGNRRILLPRRPTVSRFSRYSFP